MVTPADGDSATPGHQVILPAGSTSVVVTITAVDDGIEDPGEELSISVDVGGKAIDGGSIRINNRPLGPTVEITFEGVQPPLDQQVAGTANGPFTTRFTFSEPVRGFAEEDIVWQTHAGTTVDSTNVGVFPWDYTEVRAGVEYTVEMMPTQAGRLYIVVQPGAATSVANGYDNQWGASSLRVELPEDRMLVAPAALTVSEGDGDGAAFVVVLTSEPSGTVTVTVTGMDGTSVQASRPTVSFSPASWTSGRGVTVEARNDANASDERVPLRVEASGGGYDGQSVDVVVNVSDDDPAASPDAPENESPGLLSDVTPESAAAALLGELDLSRGQLDALDRLGNDNGRYDLGDMLSWAVRCRRAERSNRPRRRRSRCYPRGHRPDGRGRRCRSPTRTALAFLAVVTLSWGCDQGRGLVEPSAGEPEPGFLGVELAAPAGALLSGAWLAVEGPDIGELRTPGLELFEAGDGSRKEVIVAGALSPGRILEFRVPDRRPGSRYRVRSIEVTGEDFTPRDLSVYSARISR